MAHWLWLSSTAWLKVPSSSRLREDPIERGKLRSVNLLQRTRARPDSIHVWADRGRDHPEEFISQPHRWPYFFHHNGPVSHRHRQPLPMFRYALFRLLKRISLHHVINHAAGNWRGFGSPARIIMRPLGRSACTKYTCNSLDGAVARITKAPPTPSAPSRDRRSTFECRYRRLVPWPVAPYPSHEQPRPCESPFSRHIARPSGLDRRARRLRPCHRDSHRSGAER